MLIVLIYNPTNFWSIMVKISKLNEIDLNYIQYTVKINFYLYTSQYVMPVGRINTHLNTSSDPNLHHLMLIFHLSLCYHLRMIITNWSEDPAGRISTSLSFYYDTQPRLPHSHKSRILVKFSRFYNIWRW